MDEAKQKELEQKESFTVDHLARSLIMIAKDIFQKEESIWQPSAMVPVFTSQ